MPPDNLRIQQLEQQVRYLTELVNKITFTGRYVFNKDVEFFDGVKIIGGTNKGLQIGTDNLTKLGFYGKAPVVQWSGNGANSGHYGSGVGTTVRYDDKFSGSTNQGTRYFINDIVQALKDNGLIAT